MFSRLDLNAIVGDVLDALQCQLDLLVESSQAHFRVLENSRMSCKLVGS